MSLMDEIEDHCAARYRADQFAAALRSRGCPEDVIPSFLADREEQNRQMHLMANSIHSHYCCSDDCDEVVPNGVLFCEAHQAEINERRRNARSRWRRLWGR